MPDGYLSTDPNAGTPAPKGMLAAGTLDVSKQPKVKNPDGSISTVRSISINQDGKEILIPTVSTDGRLLTDREAVAEFRRTGKHLGMFTDAASATAAAQQLHQSEAAKLDGGYLSTDPNAGQSAPQQATAPPSAQPNAASRLINNYASTLLPSTTPSDYLTGPLYALQHPIDSAQLLGGAILDAHKATGAKAIDRGKAALGGDLKAIPEALGYTAATALPLLGPAAARSGEQFASGDIAGGLGTAAGLLTPSAISAARPAAGRLTATVREQLAAKADQMSTARMADVMAPKVGPGKVRFGNQAAKVAPQLAREEGLGAVTREGLQAKIDTRLEQATQALDAASNARDNTKTYPTQPIVDALKAKRGRYVAAGTEPHGKLDVTPGPNAPRVEAIDAAINELQAMGPSATYESLRRIREAYDGPAKAIYNPSMTADYLKVNGQKLGAADVTGVLREHLAGMDPNTAAANADYALYKSASDVLRATEETQRTRPSVGRKMLTTAITGSLGSTVDPGVGTAIGIALGPVVDEALNAGVTTKITTARLLAQYADALRRHQPKRATTLLGQIQTMGAATGRAKTGAKVAAPRVADRQDQQQPERQYAR